MHVFQYERFGVDGFVQEYLNEIIGTADKKRIHLEIPAYEFGEDFTNNNYTVENLKVDKYIIIPS